MRHFSRTFLETLRLAGTSRIKKAEVLEICGPCGTSTMRGKQRSTRCILTLKVSYLIPNKKTVKPIMPTHANVENCTDLVYVIYNIFTSQANKLSSVSQAPPHLFVDTASKKLFKEWCPYFRQTRSCYRYHKIIFNRSL